MIYFFRICLVTSVFIFFVPGCTAFKKKIDTSVIVALPDTLFIPSITSSALNAKYTTTITSGQVMEAFLKGFKNEGKITPNIRLTFSTDKADFILKLKVLHVTESSRNEKINDPKSSYNGQEVVLNTVDVTAEFDISSTKEPLKKLTSCANSKQRQETETNNRNIDDLVSGSNKDKTSYRTRLLDEQIALTISEDVGRRIWVPLSRRISNYTK